MKFEICEGCWIKNKEECLKLFGSADCARMIVEAMYKRSANKVLTITEGENEFTNVVEDFEDNFSQSESDLREQEEYFMRDF